MKRRTANFASIRIWFAALAACAAIGQSPAAFADITVESLTAGAVSSTGPFYQDVLDAIRKFASRDYSGAFANLESAKKLAPRLAPPEVMMAQMYFETGQLEQAQAQLEKVMTRVPQDPEALVMMAERAVRERRVTETALLYNEATKLIDKFSENPRRKQTLQIRLLTVGATADESASNWTQAQQKLESWVKLDPKDGSAHNRLARVLYRLDKQREAYAEFQLAAEADPKLPPAELSMATLATDRPKAAQWLKVAIDKGGDNLRTRLSAADFLIRDNQIEEAKVHVDAALALDPDGLESNNWAGILARMSGDYPKAVKHLSTAHLLVPTDWTVLNHLALSLAEMPDKASQLRALQFAELNIRQKTNDLDLAATAGWVNFKLNRLAEAERIFGIVLNTASAGGAKGVSPEMGYYLANMAHRRGNSTEAVRWLTESLNHNQPFAYRKQSQELLAQLSKGESGGDSKSSRMPDSRPPTEPKAITAGAGK